MTEERTRFYHGSPIGGLQTLRPAVTKYFGKPAQVCMTTLRPMALLYLIQNFEYTYMALTGRAG